MEGEGKIPGKKSTAALLKGKIRIIADRLGYFYCICFDIFREYLIYFYCLKDPL